MFETKVASVAHDPVLGAGALGIDKPKHWRPDIDGLRAVAVSSVVIFHLAQSVLPGGYVGVDIFFVISGYLISKNIFQLLRAGTFSISDFYVRRIRRIFPAYATVLAFVILATLAYDLPPVTRDVGTSALASVLSVANVYFWAITDYFGQSARDLPLLHTWSLSVEEQFYLIYPAIILAGWRWISARVWLIVLALCATSLALSLLLTSAFPLSSFYLLHTRAWELLLGALVALGIFTPVATTFGRNVVALIGAALIGASMVLFSSCTPFPGVAAVLPCLGAALLIYCGEQGETFVSRVLSLKPFVFVGLISYSLYLWHWPLFSFQLSHHLILDSDSKLLSRAAVLICSLAMATLSWWFVERPTRNRVLVPSTFLLAGAAGVFVIVAGASSALMASGGLPERFPKNVVDVARYLDVDPRPMYRDGQCFLSRTASFAQFDRSTCLPDDAGRPSYLLVGDSHAAHFLPGLRRVFPNANILQITGVMCPPVMMDTIGSWACPQLLHLAFDELPKSRSIKKVWLSANWNAGQLGSTAGWSATWMEDLKKTVQYLRSRKVEAVIIGPSPDYRAALPRVLAEAIEKNDPQWVAENQTTTPKQMDDMLSKFSAENGLAYISLVKQLCDSGRCRAYAPDGVPMLMDDSHFTESGSVFVTQAIADKLR